MVGKVGRPRKNNVDADKPKRGAGRPKGRPVKEGPFLYYGPKTPVPLRYDRRGNMVEAAKAKNGIMYFGVKKVDDVILDMAINRADPKKINGKSKMMLMKELVSLRGANLKIKKDLPYEKDPTIRKALRTQFADNNIKLESVKQLLGQFDGDTPISSKPSLVLEKQLVSLRGDNLRIKNELQTEKDPKIRKELIAKFKDNDKKIAEVKDKMNGTAKPIESVIKSVIKQPLPKLTYTKSQALTDKARMDKEQADLDIPLKISKKVIKQPLPKLTYTKSQALADKARMDKEQADLDVPLKMSKKVIKMPLQFKESYKRALSNKEVLKEDVPLKLNTFKESPFGNILHISEDSLQYVMKKERDDFIENAKKMRQMKKDIAKYAEEHRQKEMKNEIKKYAEQHRKNEAFETKMKNNIAKYAEQHRENEARQQQEHQKMLSDIENASTEHYRQTPETTGLVKKRASELKNIIKLNHTNRENIAKSMSILHDTIKVDNDENEEYLKKIKHFESLKSNIDESNRFSYFTNKAVASDKAKAKKTEAAKIAHFEKIQKDIDESNRFSYFTNKAVASDKAKAKKTEAAKIAHFEKIQKDIDESNKFSYFTNKAVASEKAKEAALKRKLSHFDKIQKDIDDAQKKRDEEYNKFSYFYDKIR